MDSHTDYPSLSFELLTLIHASIYHLDPNGDSYLHTTGMACNIGLRNCFRCGGSGDGQPSHG
jgi:hypothetical protein